MKKKVKKSLRSKKNKKGGGLPLVTLFVATFGAGIFAAAKKLSKDSKNRTGKSPSKPTQSEIKSSDLSVGNKDLTNIFVNAINKNNKEYIYSPKKGVYNNYLRYNLNLKKYFNWYKDTNVLIEKYARRKNISEDKYKNKRTKIEEEQQELQTQLEAKRQELQELEKHKEHNTKYFDYINKMINQDDKEGIVEKVSNYLKSLQPEVAATATAAQPAVAETATAAQPAVAAKAAATAVAATATAAQPVAVTRLAATPTHPPLPPSSPPPPTLPLPGQLPFHYNGSNIINAAVAGYAGQSSGDPNFYTHDPYDNTYHPQGNMLYYPANHNPYYHQ